MLKLRWNSQSGAVYVDGQHFKVSSSIGRNRNSSVCYFNNAANRYFICMLLLLLLYVVLLTFFLNVCQKQHNLELGDEIRIDSHAPCLKIFDVVESQVGVYETEKIHM